MTSILRVTPDQLNALGASCGRTAGEVRSSHQVLRSQLSPLFGSEWSGTAATQFGSLYEQFDRNAEGLVAALDGIGRLLTSAGGNYAAVEQQIAASFRS